MLIATLIVTAVALVVVVWLLRRASVAPKDWAKRHSPGDASDSTDTSPSSPADESAEGGGEPPVS